jgi:acyl carrier protein
MVTVRGVSVDRDLGQRKRVASALRGLLRELYELEVDELHPNVRFNEDLGLDSLSVLALLAELEDQLELTINVQELAEIATVGQVLDLTLSKVGIASDEG